ncbi:MAG: AAC(3) family N-acetyltransferase [Opitutaceae bacterium]|jgi:aminoglycoside 3-N-acetyltransferase
MNDVVCQMTRDLAGLGVRKGGLLLVHSSLRSLGVLPDGPETAVEGLLEALGSEGTLLMPALSYETVSAEHPVFDVLNTPSCVGALPEFFRKRTGTMRSVHPTHSVCGIGPGAGRLLGEHSRDITPCGKHSPFSKLNEEAGQILFLGCGLKPNTSMHGVEELVEPPYLYGDWVDYRIKLADGGETAMRVRAHNFKGWQQRYDRIETVMAGEGIRAGWVLSADCFLLEAPVLWRKAHQAMEVAPLYFVDPMT